MAPYDKYRTVKENFSTNFLIEQREFLSTVGIYAPPNFSENLAEELLEQANAILAKRGYSPITMRKS